MLQHCRYPVGTYTNNDYMNIINLEMKHGIETHNRQKSTYKTKRRKINFPKNRNIYIYMYIYILFIIIVIFIIIIIIIIITIIIVIVLYV